MEKNQKIIFKENNHLCWIADTYRQSIKQSRTARWMKIKIKNQINKLEQVGQPKKWSFKLLEIMGVILDNYVEENIKPLPLP